MIITKTIGFCINGKGVPDFFIIDHNPGYLAHACQIEVEVPDDIVECLTRKVKCVTLYKMKPMSSVCVKDEKEE